MMSYSNEDLKRDGRNISVNSTATVHLKEIKAASLMLGFHSTVTLPQDQDKSNLRFNWENLSLVEGFREIG